MSFFLSAQALSWISSDGLLVVRVNLTRVEQDGAEANNHEWHDVEVERDVEVSEDLVNYNKTRIHLHWSCGRLVNNVINELADGSDVADSFVACCALDLNFFILNGHIDGNFLFSEVEVRF